ncbi:MAG: pyruvate dehydrogenase E2 component (dihydrolipoamide acetyltransferase) [Phycisphaerales bacterium]|jgi:pyruvate dehydrogenase E2 component (dihydrolipoamide acetyltransferase)
MTIEITMPRLSDTMEQGTVVKWNIKAGDTVAAGDVIADIETDKATMELESFDDGTVASLAVAEGEQVPVGSVIVVLAEEGEDVTKAASSAGASAAQAGTATTTIAPPATSAPAAAPTAAPAPAPAPGGDSNSRVFASPLAKKIASEQGVNITAINGTGPSGRITRKDVEQAAKAGPSTAPAATTPAGSPATAAALSAGSVSAPAAPETLPAAGGVLEEKLVPLSNMRGTIARVLVASKTTIPHYQVSVSARMDRLMELRTQLNEQLEPQGVKLSVNDFLVRACSVAMHTHPFINASWVEQGPAIQLHQRVNVGVAISLPAERGGGLVVATIRDSDRIGLRQISTETRRLAKKAREKGLTIDEMSDSTFTISNLGMFGVDHFTAIINPPNAAILAVGRAIEKPFVEYDENGEPELVVGHEMTMTISSDHRIIDGAMAAQYLNSVKSLLENPATLLV